MADGSTPESSDIRCFCERKPLLAKIVYRKGRPIVHIKVYKANRIYTEVEINFGHFKIHCRECLRWHTITIVRGVAEVHSPYAGVDPVAPNDTAHVL